VLHRVTHWRANEIARRGTITREREARTLI